MNNWPWDELGLSGPAELPAIRRAYAERLKSARPEENPEGFQRLHGAYQAACQLARRGAAENVTEIETPETENNQNLSGAESESPSTTEPVREWDFERLFAEGAAEERARRFQKLWTLRQKNQSRYDAWRPPPPRDAAQAALAWIAVTRAVALLEELASGGAEASLWEMFCKSELFRYVRNQPDFVFALEDFLREYPEIPETGCLSLFRAYGFDARPAGREYRLLYQLLKARIPRGDAPPRLSVILILLWIVVTFNILTDASIVDGNRKALVRDWMETDFKREFVRAESRDEGSVCALTDEAIPLDFRARWNGARDATRGRRGYVTDYTQELMSWAIVDFAEGRDCTAFPYRDAGRLGSGREKYLRFPLTGAGEDISALGNLLSAVREAGWYQELPPDYVLYLCWEDWSFYAYDARTDDFDADALRQYYERFFGPDLCRIVLEETGIAGEGLLLFTESGTVSIENRHFFHVVGVEKTHFRPQYHYFLSDDGTELFCVPTGGRVSELTLAELYRMDKAAYEVKGFPDTLSVFRDAQ